MSPVHLLLGARFMAAAVGLAGLVLATVHLTGDGFEDTLVVGAVIVVVIVGSLWLVIEAICLVIESIDASRAEMRACYGALLEARTDAETIGARSIEKYVNSVRGTGGDDDSHGANVVGINGYHRR